MEKIMVCRKTVLDEQAQCMKLDYSVLIGLDESGRIYGVEIKKTAADGTAEKDAFFGISKQYETAEAFIRRLSKATALPVELAALCDDFISETEACFSVS